MRLVRVLAVASVLTVVGAGGRESRARDGGRSPIRLAWRVGGVGARANPATSTPNSSERQGDHQAAASPDRHAVKHAAWPRAHPSVVAIR